jgi:hypothetical protein
MFSPFLEDLPAALEPRGRVAGQLRRAAEILDISLDELNLKIRSYGSEE